MGSAVVVDVRKSFKWDEYRASARHSGGRWAISDRGWLFIPGVSSSLGNYLDYGPDHYRSGHEYCREGRCDCRESQPGNIHCVVYRGERGAVCRYVETVEQAKAWIEANAEVL